MSQVKVELKKQDHGVVWTTKFIQADVAEVIRGEYDDKRFTCRDTGYEMTDKIQAKAHYNEYQF